MKEKTAKLQPTSTNDDADNTGLPNAYGLRLRLRPTCASRTETSR